MKVLNLTGVTQKARGSYRITDDQKEYFKFKL